MNMADMGEDMDGLLAKLGYVQVDAMGYSMGAGIAFRLAVQHPTRVRRLVLVSGSSRTTASIRRCCRYRRRSAARWPR
jgi:pimeloyl-ACP methyl ester carboxylesterase